MVVNWDPPSFQTLNALCEDWQGPVPDRAELGLTSLPVRGKAEADTLEFYWG